jgi:hypothetical protein
MLGLVTKRPHANLELIRRVLGSEYLELKIKHLSLTETVEQDAKSKVSITALDGDKELLVEGEGCGLVDAVWSALLARFAAEYESLKTIELSAFSIDARLDTKTHKDGLDSVGEVKLQVKNSDGLVFEFTDASRSIAASSARAVLAAVEYFVNAERAFITLHRSREDAKERSRSDLVARYTSELAEVVKSTSYAEVIEKIKKTALAPEL